MAAKTRNFVSFNNGGVMVTVTVTLDDVTGKVASLDWNNAGAAAGIWVTIDTNPPVYRDMPSGPGQYVPPGAGITMFKDVNGLWHFPYNVSIATA